jgi:peptidoglycan/xylan/chitin deacetylase (PgdA/CDA1 family)
MDRLLMPVGAAWAEALTERPIVGSPELLRLDDWHVYATPVGHTDGAHPGRTVRSFARADGGSIDVVADEQGRLTAPFDLDEAYRNYLSEAWTRRSGHRHLSAWQLAFYYRAKRLVSRRAQLWARRQLIRWQGRPSFASWPIDDGVHRLLQLHAAQRLSVSGQSTGSFCWFWPGDYRAALALGHDVETAEGTRLAVELADLEEELGFRSVFNFGDWYDVDPGVLRELTSRGFEIGMHGIIHDRSLFSSRAEFERQLPLLQRLADRLGATGFRSPATHRVFDWLPELPIEYDATISHSDPYEPQPGGCCSLWPFFIGDLVELPYTVPQDHTLLTLLGHRTASLWLETARAIEERFGLVHCVTHPDPGYLGDAEKRAVYRQFLEGMAAREGVWRALPREIAAWWRLRDSGGAPLNEGRVVSGGDELSVAFVAPARTAT